MTLLIPRRPWALPALGAAIVAVALGARAGADTPRQAAGASPPPAAGAAPTSTTAGVYTTAQAARGEETFANVCQGCHSTADYLTAKFREAWKGKPVAEFFRLISETMPEDAPGTLQPAEYAQVIAYILKLNRLPDGKTDLPADPDALKAITIDFGAETSALEHGAR